MCVCVCTHVCAHPHNGGVNGGMPQQPDKQRHKDRSLFGMAHALVSASTSSRRNRIFPSFPQTAAQLRKIANVKNKFRRNRKPGISRNIRALSTEALVWRCGKRSDAPDAYLKLPDSRRFCLRLKLHRRPVALSSGNGKEKTVKIR